jgi:prepilin-type N-terminal cleavage/methylation domain-containing protein
MKGTGVHRGERPDGFTLLELVITLFILAILTMGVMPLVQAAVQRQREQRLREALREMRTAIEQFHRDAMGGPCAPPQPSAVQGGGVPNSPNQQPNQPGQQVQASIDPRSRVMITDCTIFSVDNPDRYPPDLDTLVKGVNVAPRAGAANQMGGVGLGGDNRNATDVSGTTLATKKKIYLREIPVDPITGKREWDLRSLYDSADASSWGGENIFDVRSQSKLTALNGEKYNEW